MADTTASGVQMPDTDYRYQGMTDAFIARNNAAADALSKLSTDSLGVMSGQLIGLGAIHQQWLGSFAQTQPAITANTIASLNASSADSILNFIKIGAALANSASPPIPGYQNLGPLYPGGFGGGGGGTTAKPTGT